MSLALGGFARLIGCPSSAFRGVVLADHAPSFATIACRLVLGASHFGGGTRCARVLQLRHGCLGGALCTRHLLVTSWFHDAKIVSQWLDFMVEERIGEEAVKAISMIPQDLDKLYTWNSRRGSRTSGDVPGLLRNDLLSSCVSLGVMQ